MCTPLSPDRSPDRQWMCTCMLWCDFRVPILDHVRAVIRTVEFASFRIAKPHARMRFQGTHFGSCTDIRTGPDYGPYIPMYGPLSGPWNLHQFALRNPMLWCDFRVSILDHVRAVIRTGPDYGPYIAMYGPLSGPWNLHQFALRNPMLRCDFRVPILNHVRAVVRTVLRTSPDREKCVPP